MLFKLTPRQNNIIKTPTYISFLKNDRFSGYKNLALILAVIWGFLGFATSGIIQAISILLMIASVLGFILVPQIAKKHQKDQFVIEYQFGLHDVTEGLQKKIPWTNVVCFVNSYEKKDKKSGDFESTFYVITTNDYIKLDKVSFDEKQLQQIYNILAPYLNQFKRYVAGEGLVRSELKDINYIRQALQTQFSGYLNS